MCMFKTPQMPAAPPERQAARAPDRSGPAASTASDITRRRLALASSIFTSPTLGAPSTTRPLGA